MIEQIMIFLLGALVATLAALLIMPAIWNRAVRLTTRRIEAAVPTSVQEIHADKDLQRAGFALSQRRLELQMDALRERMMREARLSEDSRQRADELERALEERTRQLAQVEEALTACVARPSTAQDGPYPMPLAAPERESALRLELDTLRLELAAFKAAVAARNGGEASHRAAAAFATAEDVALVRHRLAEIAARLVAQGEPHGRAAEPQANREGPV